MRCPVCRAENDQGPQCRRCRADLELLFAIEEQRGQVLDVAYHCLMAGQPRRAQALVDGARALHDDGEAQRLGALCALMCGDFAAAWRDYQVVTGE
jgi:hypothetical protein